MWREQGEEEGTIGNRGQRGVGEADEEKLWSSNIVPPYLKIIVEIMYSLTRSQHLVFSLSYTVKIIYYM